MTASMRVDDFAAGKYRFGMWDMMIRACNLIFTILSVFMSPDVSLSLPMTKFFSARYVKRNLVLVAIDEAHCITDW